MDSNRTGQDRVWRRECVSVRYCGKLWNCQTTANSPECKRSERQRVKRPKELKGHRPADTHTDTRGKIDKWSQMTIFTQRIRWLVLLLAGEEVHKLKESKKEKNGRMRNQFVIHQPPTWKTTHVCIRFRARPANLITKSQFSNERFRRKAFELKTNF